MALEGSNHTVVEGVRVVVLEEEEDVEALTVGESEVTVVLVLSIVFVVALVAASVVAFVAAIDRNTSTILS